MPEGGYRTLPELLIEWLTSIVTAILGMFGKTEQGTLGTPARQTEDTVPTPTDGRTERFSLPQGAVAALQGQLNKLSISRRLMLLQETRTLLLTRIKESRRTIRKLSKGERALFEGYMQLLAEIDTKSRLLYDHAERAAQELRRHNVPRIESEIARLQTQLERTTSGPETERTLEARRALLRTLEAFADRLASSEAQLGYLVATLELNHLRVIEISAHTANATSESIDSMTARTEQLTDQLGILDQFLRSPDTL